MKTLNKKEIAEKTLEIIKSGLLENKNISEEIQKNIDLTFTISPDEFANYLSKEIENKSENQQIEICNCSTIEAIRKFENTGKIAVLNFASAKNPGGGFMGGASAQEESLARSSSLYASLTKDTKMYEYNRKLKHYLYSNYAIYSPETVFWFDDYGNNLENPLFVDVITSPAPNKGAMLQHNRLEEINAIEQTLKNRIEFVLKIAAVNNIDTLILGAWGCGVFRNDVESVAKYFHETINRVAPSAFDKIVFAIYDSSEKKNNYSLFKTILKNENSF
jgi:uncharacterized protein (TIGR02452 family)